MYYTQKSFTLPTCGRKITDEEYGIAVGTICPKCRKKLDKECQCKKMITELAAAASVPVAAALAGRQHQAPLADPAQPDQD